MYPGEYSRACGSGTPRFVQNIFIVLSSSPSQWRARANTTKPWREFGAQLQENDDIEALSGLYWRIPQVNVRTYCSGTGTPNMRAHPTRGKPTLLADYVPRNAGVPLLEDALFKHAVWTQGSHRRKPLLYIQARCPYETNLGLLAMHPHTSGPRVYRSGTSAKECKAQGTHDIT